ncbi:MULTISPECIES: cytochrome P450 [unclassified Leptolyngbya]|uniref:cytochrome P450 n=1 Tax=unclassified Leptolyngbya TaxID=2650499 RepID=UPI001681FA41|nr:MULTISPECIES: cytochrome P450 [unclassified Leptolyngbya]MBD1909445.1 cytochrome P450 [Leptolyngbya sp. FACHB-8]MBD2155658.1 cytochrome P450 [Leptolyngbya sp. FACHB-16]
MGQPIAPLSLPPGEFGLPFIGETLSFFGDPNYAKKKHQKYGSIFKTRLLGQPTIFVRGSEFNQFILTNDNKYFEISWPPSTRMLLGPLSLALQTGGTHQSRRKLLAQAFMPRALSGYIPAMQEIIQSYTKRWAEQGQLVWYPELRNYTLDVACKLLVGIDHGSQSELGHLFETWCQGLFSIPLDLPWTQFGKAKRARHKLLKLIEEIIRDRQKSPESGTDTLGLLLQARDDDGNGLSLEELKDQTLLLLFAGHETLTSAIASFCMLIAQHPLVWEKLRTEQQLFDTAIPTTLDSLKQMTYLDQVLQEVMRLIPPVGGGFRRVIQSCEMSGFQMPEGWNVLYEINQTHMNPLEHAEPDRFQPERFGTTQAGVQSKYSYLPFGGGIRECLGKEFARLEMKLFAAHLVRYYTWELLPDQDLSMVVMPTPHPRDNLRVTFRSLTKTIG